MSTDLVRFKIEEFHWTYDRLSNYLKSLYPGRTGKRSTRVWMHFLAFAYFLHIRA